MLNSISTAPLASDVLALPKISRSIPVQIPAATSLNGQVTPSEIGITAGGNQFYVRVCSATITLQTVRAGNIGAENPFNNGQGQTVKGGFETLTAKNYNLFPITALIWVGFEDFINDQLVLDNTTLMPVVYPTYPVANAADIVEIRDLSGQSFLDINGKKWLAVSRIAILCFNLDSGTTALLYEVGGSADSPAAGVIYPAPLPIRFDGYSGDFDINLGGSTINMIVTELYQAFAA